MRQLTLAGFTKRYVASLSCDKSTSVYALVREANTTNPRLREPLYVYAAANGCLDTLLLASRKTTMHESYERLARQFPAASLEDAFRRGDNTLPEEYHKVWRSYVTERDRHLRDDRVKELMRQKILKLQQVKGVSTYRLCKDLNLNNSNINYWLKNGDTGKLRLDTARSVLQYIEGK